MKQCPICKQEKHPDALQFVATREDKYRKCFSHEVPPAAYFECIKCKAMIFEGAASFENAYSEGAYYSVDGDPQEFLSKRFTQVMSLPREESDNEHRVLRIRSFVMQQAASNGKMSVLDIGAGTGVFLARFLDSDWIGTAVEPDPEACKHLSRVLSDVEVYQGFSTEVSYKKQFDLITLNRVLEHTADPITVLKHEIKNLADSGTIYLELPDVESYYLDGANNEAFGYGHYVVYSPDSISILAEKCGYDVHGLTRVKEPSTKYTIYAFLKKKK